MTIDLQLGGIRFHIEADTALRIEDSAAPFLCDDSAPETVNIHLVQSLADAPLPNVPVTGKDLILEYYLEKDRLLCAARGIGESYVSITACDLDCKEIVCYLHPCHVNALNSVGNLLRLIPMRMILQKREAILFHAAQISVGGKGILFTAPSGTGKTTQAMLWKKHRNARIVCNDRTLIRHGKTYGFPVDGSEPIFSSDSFALGAVVLLEQSPVNKIKQLKVREALVRLMPQMVCDCWNGDAVSVATHQILELIRRFPVYLLSCTPDEDAVICLEQQLIKDGVL